ncbi:hypothetical protein SAMN05443247_06526 [Bradyrhizobium erythrophlei]|nr:hypothetical protein SAMN05443247_06526 [Bradyrhizobium erythrophlei]
MPRGRNSSRTYYGGGGRGRTMTQAEVRQRHPELPWPGIINADVVKKVLRDIAGADLRDADLRDADLRDAEQEVGS